MKNSRKSSSHLPDLPWLMFSLFLACWRNYWDYYYTGEVEDHILLNCYFAGKVEYNILLDRYFAGKIEGDILLDCFTDTADANELLNCYFTGKVEDNILPDCYFTGKVDGNNFYLDDCESKKSKLLCWARTSCVILLSYWLINGLFISSQRHDDNFDLHVLFAHSRWKWRDES